MSLQHLAPSKWRATAVASALALLTSTMPMSAQTGSTALPRSSTQTPIQHVIVIIGENRTFDHVFATYKPTVSGETIDNLLSKGIVNEDGSPGPNYGVSLQFSALDNKADKFQISPNGKSLYPQLPPPVVGGYFNPPFSTIAEAKKAENGLADAYYKYLTTGGTAPLSKPDIDTRIPGVYNLAPGPFQLTSYSFPYDAYANSPVHRFYQMWQQSDCNAFYATTDNPSGCNADLFPWVEVSVGAGTNGLPQKQPFTETSTGEGATAMSFYNVLQGDAPYLKSLADNYAMSDNYHQAVMGGTGANHIMLGTGDAIWFSDGQGRPAMPPTINWWESARKTRVSSTKSRIRMRRRARTTGIKRTATAAVLMDRLRMGAAATATAPTPLNLASSQCLTTFRTYPIKSTRSALPEAITC